MGILADSADTTSRRACRRWAGRSRRADGCAALPPEAPTRSRPRPPVAPRGIQQEANNRQHAHGQHRAAPAGTFTTEIARGRCARVDCVATRSAVLQPVVLSGNIQHVVCNVKRCNHGYSSGQCQRLLQPRSTSALLVRMHAVGRLLREPRCVPLCAEHLLLVCCMLRITVFVLSRTATGPERSGTTEIPPRSGYIRMLHLLQHSSTRERRGSV